MGGGISVDAVGRSERQRQCRIRVGERSQLEEQLGGYRGGLEASLRGEGTQQSVVTELGHSRRRKSVRTRRGAASRARQAGSQQELKRF